MERHSELEIGNVSNITKLNQIKEKYNALSAEGANKTINLLGKKTKRQTYKSEIQKMMDTVRKKAQTDEMIKPVLESLKYDLKSAGADVLAELTRLRFKIKKLGLGKELCEGKLSTFVVSSSKFGNKGAFITNDLFYYVVFLYERLATENRKLIDSIENVYVCNTSELFLNEKQELQEFFYEDSLQEASACGYLNNINTEFIEVTIDTRKNNKDPGKLTYKGQTYMYEMVPLKEKPLFIMANQKYWEINTFEGNKYEYIFKIPKFQLFHISKELKSGIKRVGKKKGLFVIGSSITPTDVASKNLLLNCDASFEYMIKATLNKSDLLNLITEKKEVPSFVCNMENILILIELITLAGFLSNNNISDILEEYKKYRATFALYKKLYTKLMSVICKYFDWFIERVNYDRILELKKHVDDTLSFWEEIGTTGVESYLREWILMLLTCNGAYTLEEDNNLILNFFSNLNELKSMLLKTKTALVKIIDLSIKAEVIEPQLRALAVGYRRFMLNGSIKCFTMIRTVYAFMGNTIGNDTIEDLVKELNKMKVEAYRSSAVLLTSKLENIRNEMASDFTSLMNLTSGLNEKDKKQIFEKDKKIKKKFIKVAEMNISLPEISSNEYLLSDIYNIYNQWAKIVGRPQTRSKNIKVRKFKTLGNKRELVNEEMTYQIKENGAIKENDGPNGIVNFTQKNIEKEDEPNAEDVMIEIEVDD